MGQLRIRYECPNCGGEHPRADCPSDPDGATRRPRTVAPSRAQIEAARTRRGGYTRARLAAWGVPWPPPSGWRKRLLREADRRDGTSPSPSPREPRPRLVAGRPHPCWPEWTWDGEWFVRTPRA